MLSLNDLIIIIPSFLIAITIHEASHGIMAKWMGDPTAYIMGRITLNPLKHLDPIGTLMIIFVGFGWGKPVPINPTYFKNKKIGNAITSFAGPFSNIFLALIIMAIFKHVSINSEMIKYILKILISINLILAIFNLFPIPPLDGSHILELFIPKSLENKWNIIETNSPFILFILLVGDKYFHLEILSRILWFLTDFLYGFLYSIT